MQKEQARQAKGGAPKQTSEFRMDKSKSKKYPEWFMVKLKATGPKLTEFSGQEFVCVNHVIQLYNMLLLEHLHELTGFEQLETEDGVPKYLNWEYRRAMESFADKDPTATNKWMFRDYNQRTAGKAQTEAAKMDASTKQTGAARVEKRIKHVIQLVED